MKQVINMTIERDGELHTMRVERESDGLLTLVAARNLSVELTDFATSVMEAADALMPCKSMDSPHYRMPEVWRFNALK